MMRRDTLAAIDPVEGSEVERVASSPVFEELRRDIMATDPRARESGPHDTASIALRPASRRSRLAVVVAGATVVIVLAGLLVLGGSGNPGKEPTTVTAKAGTWKLADDVLSGTWQQYTSGPPPGSFTCPTTSICYTMSGQYASAMAGS